MARYLRIENGVVVNAEEWAHQPPSIPGVTYIASDIHPIGATWDGTTFADPPNVQPVPQGVSRTQALIALQRAGLLATVETYMTAQGTPAEQVIYWKNSPSFRRDHPILAAVAQAVGLTSAQVDTLFQQAAQIPE